MTANGGKADYRGDTCWKAYRKRKIVNDDQGTVRHAVRFFLCSDYSSSRVAVPAERPGDDKRRSKERCAIQTVLCYRPINVALLRFSVVAFGPQDNPP